MNRTPSKSLALFGALLAFSLSLTGCDNPQAGKPPIASGNLSALNHIVVVYQENWSFDSLYGQFPGANGLPFGKAVSQTDKSGNPMSSLPQALGNNDQPDPRFPSSLPVAPFNMQQYVQPGDTTGDIIHRYYHEQLQINGGVNDRFVTWSDNPGLVLGFFDATTLPEGKLAQQYTLLDNMFHSAFGGSFLNHQYLICACTPTFPNAPSSLISNPDPANLKDAQVTPDGFAVNTIFATYAPHPSSVPAANLLPPQTLPTIGDRLDAAGVSWAWYSGGWNNALAGNPDPLFQFHHQPFAYYKSYADGTQAKSTHLRDEADFFAAVGNGSLPAVTFIKPLGPDNEHPGYASLQQGQNHVATIVNAIKNSPYWNDTAIVITYDENGGRYDHVAPPVVDRWGPGTRVPGIIVSRFAKRGFIDHTQYETTSILSLIEKRFSLQPLGAHDAASNPFSNAFDFTQSAASTARQPR